jgi:hypothetical protein
VGPIAELPHNSHRSWKKIHWVIERESSTKPFALAIFETGTLGRTIHIFFNQAHNLMDGSGLSQIMSTLLPELLPIDRERRLKN